MGARELTSDFMHKGNYQLSYWQKKNCTTQNAAGMPLYQFDDKICMDLLPNFMSQYKQEREKISFGEQRSKRC